MTFPQTALPLEVAFQIGGTWTDVTADVRGEQQVRITRGRSDWGQDVDSTRCSFTLDNNSGKYTPKNPTGPYYGLIGRNTPCRVSVLTGTPYLDLPGGIADYAQTVDTASLDITGDIDVRLDASWANWLAPIGSSIAGTVEMLGKFNGDTQKSWLLGSREGRLYFEWSADGTTSLSASSTLPPVIPGGGGRLAVRVTLDVNNGASGNTVRFYTAATLDSPWVQLGDPVTQSGTTSIFNSTAPLRVGQATNYTFKLPVGRVHAAEIRNGLWGTVVAQPYFSAQSVGTTSFADSAGRTWTLNGSAAITNRRTRFVGEVSAWPTRWETKFDVVVQTEASGILRRLTQGASPVRSAMYRELTNSSRSGIVGYWPMEDDASATGFASALPGSAAMKVPSGSTLATYSGWVASAPLPTFSFGTTKARIAPYTATGYIFTRFFVGAPAAGATGNDRLFSFTTTGTARTWALYVSAAGNLDLRAYDADGTQLFATGFLVFAINGKPRHMAIELTQNGANIDWTLIAYRIDEATLTVSSQTATSGTLAANTFGAATEIRIGQDGLLNGTAVGHVAIASSSSSFAATAGAMVGWREETASARINRLGMEEAFAAYSAAGSDQEMGVQGMSTLVDLLREAEAVDEGILCEQREFLGLRLRDHISLYNQAAALTLNYTGSSALVTPLEPTDDDQGVRNDITVQRTDGSSARVTLDTGALSTLAPPSGVGRYTDSVTLNLSDDDQTTEHAGWRLHLGTWDETRYPLVKVVLSKTPGSLETAAAVDIGDRIQITNPPAWLPPDTIDLQVQGYSEVLDQFTWNIDFNCTPAGPWDAAWAGDASTASSPREFQWTDTAGSALLEPLTSTETDVDVSTTSGPVWSPNVRDTPFDWRIAGEVMTVTAPHLLINPNPFFDTSVANWAAQSSAMTWSQTYVHPHPRALGSMRIVPDGVSAAGGALGDLTGVGSITPGGVYTLSAWVFSVNGWTDLQPAVNWYDSGGALISSVTGTSMSASASVWTWLEQTFTAPATASQAKVRMRHGGTPAASDIWYVWAARISRGSSSWLHDAFGRTAASSWSLADSGQAWSTGGGTATDYNVGSGYGGHILATTNASRRTFVDYTYADFDVYVDVTTSAAATGGSLFGGPTGRYLDSDNLYMARVEFTTAGGLLLTIRKRVAATETQLGTYTLELGTYTAGTAIRVRFQASGTTLRAKAWRAAGTEPDLWHVSVTDSSITTSSFLGLRSITAAGNTNVNPEVRYDNLALVNPQSYTVTRSQNRAVKAQSAGASVALAYPAYLAL
jgi:hypothetical protein